MVYRASISRYNVGGHDFGSTVDFDKKPGRRTFSSDGPFDSRDAIDNQHDVAKQEERFAEQWRREHGTEYSRNLERLAERVKNIIYEEDVSLKRLKVLSHVNDSDLFMVDVAVGMLMRRGAIRYGRGDYKNGTVDPVYVKV